MKKQNLAIAALVLLSSLASCQKEELPPFNPQDFDLDTLEVKEKEKEDTIDVKYSDAALEKCQIKTSKSYQEGKTDTFWAFYEYDSEGNYIQETDPGDTFYSYSYKYNRDGKCIEMISTKRHPEPGSPNSDTSFFEWENGNLARNGRIKNGVKVYSTEYFYDMSRINTIKVEKGFGLWTSRNLTIKQQPIGSAAGRAISYVYDFDKFGRAIKKTRLPYNSGNRLIPAHYSEYTYR